MKRWTIHETPTVAQINEIATLLRSGGVVLMPTDTIYGLHAIASEEAAARIAQIKGRENEKRFITLAASIAQLEKIGVAVPSALRRVWPAPVTAILPRGAQSFAARVPDLPWLRDLLEQTGPLISTSANRSGERPTEDPAELPTPLANAIDGVVDAGRREGKASAIVDFTGAEPRVIREGEPRFTQMLRKTLMKKL